MKVLARSARRLDPTVLRGALWAAIAARLVRYRLKRHGLQARVPRPPQLGPVATRGVMGALRRLDPTCLERALVEQAWLVSLGIRRDVVIGVLRDGFESGPAHAWVDGTSREAEATYLELHRLPPAEPFLLEGGAVSSCSARSCTVKSPFSTRGRTHYRRKRAT